jgi:hypothetical protein
MSRLRAIHSALHAPRSAVKVELLVGLPVGNLLARQSHYLSATTPENWQAASVLPEHAEFWKLDRVLTRSLRDACEIGAATVKSSSEPSHSLTHPLSHLHRQHAQSLSARLLRRN